MKSPLLPGGPRRSLLVSEPTHSSFSATTVKIIKCFIGAASFELPGAIKNGGLHASLAGILALAAVSYYTLRMLARCGELLNTRSATYPEIGRAAAGRPGYAAAWLGIVFMTLGVCSAYYTFVANMLADLLQDSHPFFTRVHSVLLLLPAFVLLSWGPYKHLSKFSALGISALVFALLVVLYDAAKYNSVQPMSEYPTFEPDTFPLFLGNTAFVYLIHSVVLPMRNQMEAPRFCPRTLFVAILAVTALNTAFAVPAYLLYFDATEGNIIDNLHPGNLKRAVQIALCVDLFLTFALFLFPMAEALENDLRQLIIERREWRGRSEKEEEEEEEEEEGKASGGAETEEAADLPWQFRAFLRATLVVATALLALLVKDFSAMSALSGGFGNNLVGFILPPVFITMIKIRQDWWKKSGVGSTMKWLEIGGNAAVAAGGVGLLISSLRTFLDNL